MAFVYEQHEIDLLVEEFRLAIQPSEDRGLSVPAIDLLDRDKSLAYFTRTAEVFKAETLMANASLFGKRYSFLAAASCLYAMSVFDKGLDYSIENAHIESIWKEDLWLPKIRLNDWQVSRPEAGGRAEWRDRVISNLFAENLSRAWDAISRNAPVSKAVLWENTSIYVFWLYESRMLQGIGEEMQARVREDFAYLIQAPAHLFGEKKNPLARYYGPKVETVACEQPIRIRKTCCYYYQASDEPEDYCSSCPKIKHELLPVSTS
ncbi:(2Fe-2S)-binding protein [Paenibacillus pasadenensis]|uniref:IucA/IucC family C-terminal-domain containing protein n=1 Tax=Paenibacillus pasadenensis TaxID=217090 RepID=UPI00203BBD84|nr:IucA/IucC family C-terminal-domain containing protein [Paenibacillus pasadenensis]MCM3746423.1 (2Fe-2S)-binding protein [Paenibacillus pasadenensis]